MLDSNQRRQKPAGLQPAPIGHSGNPPKTVCHPSSSPCGTSTSISLGSHRFLSRRFLSYIRAGEGTRTPNRLFTKQVLYLLSYTSESRRLLGDPGHPGSMSPKHRPAEMVSKVEFALNMRYVRQVVAIRSAPSADALRPVPHVVAPGTRVGNCALRFAFALPAGKKTTHVEESSGTSHRRPETRKREPHAASSRLAHATWGEHECTSPERRALVALAPGTVKHNSYRPADAVVRARRPRFLPPHLAE